LVEIKDINCIHCSDGKGKFKKVKVEQFALQANRAKKEINIYKCRTCKGIIWRFTDMDSNVSRETLVRNDLL
jgi:hypothetical protein